jgi:hypothetical protein
MTTYAIEGVGATVSFGTSTYACDLITLTLPEKTRATIETTHLGTTVAKTYKPAKLKDVGTVSLEYDHNPAADDLTDNVIETVTINYPLLSGQSVAAKLVFSGFVTKQGGEEFKVDSRMTTKITVQVSGDFAFTAAT